MQPKYPFIHVILVGSNGDPAAIVGRVQQALRDHQVPGRGVRRFTREAISGDHLLEVVKRWVSTEDPNNG